ncbi:MAG: hypothetical protein ACYC23_14485 [Limisphaerales bacterium]
MNTLPELPRRTIEELVLRYQLEPSMRDVFVEGHSDHTILRWFIDACCSEGANVEIYPIDGVDVPVEILNRYGLSTGNRSEVVALCLELEQQLGNCATCVTGVVDRDMDAILPDQWECGLLLKSDYSCVEMYLFAEKCLAKMLKLAFPNAKRSAAEVVAQLSPVLRELFLARAVNHSLALGSKWIAFDGFVLVKNGVIHFRLEDFHRHYLQNGGQWHKRLEFEAKVNEFRAQLPGDFRYGANGHDAICVLGHFLKSYCKKAKDAERTQPHLLVHLLTCSLEAIDVQEEPMFKNLLNRLAAEPCHE